MDRKMKYRCSYHKFTMSRDKGVMRGSIRILRKGDDYYPLDSDNWDDLALGNTSYIEHTFEATANLEIKDDYEVVAVNDMVITVSEIKEWCMLLEDFIDFEDCCPVAHEKIKAATISGVIDTMLNCEYGRSDEEIAEAIDQYLEAEIAGFSLTPQSNQASHHQRYSDKPCSIEWGFLCGGMDLRVPVSDDPNQVMGLLFKEQKSSKGIKVRC